MCLPLLMGMGANVNRRNFFKVMGLAGVSAWLAGNVNGEVEAETVIEVGNPGFRLEDIGRVGTGERVIWAEDTNIPVSLQHAPIGTIYRTMGTGNKSINEWMKVADNRWVIT